MIEALSEERDGILGLRGIHARRDIPGTVESQASGQRLAIARRVTLRVTRRSSGDSVPGPLAGLRPAPTRERAHLPVATKGNGIPAHVFVRYAFSFFFGTYQIRLTSPRTQGTHRSIP